MPKTKRQFPKDFRVEAAKLVINGGRNCSDVARSHNLAPSLLVGWLRQARVDAGDNPRKKATSSDKDGLTRLRKARRDAAMAYALPKQQQPTSQPSNDKSWGYRQTDC